MWRTELPLEQILLCILSSGESCHLLTLITTIQLTALRMCVLNECSMLKLFVFIIQCNPVQCDGLEWSLNCVRMFLCSTLPMRGGRQVQRCLCVCENSLQNKFRDGAGLQVNWYEKPLFNLQVIYSFRILLFVPMAPLDKNIYIKCSCEYLHYQH